MLTRADRPNAEEVLGVVCDALAVVLEVDPNGVSRATNLADLGVDSLSLVEVAEIVEEQVATHAHAPFVIPDSELASMCTVGDVADSVLARL